VRGVTGVFDEALARTPLPNKVGHAIGWMTNAVAKYTATELDGSKCRTPTGA